VDIMNMRKLDAVIKDGKVLDRAYHPWFKGGMFSNTTLSYNRDTVDLAWELGLKAASGAGRRGGAAEGEGAQPAVAAAPAAAAPGAQPGGRNPQSGVANSRRSGGLGAVPDPSL